MDKKSTLSFKRGGTVQLFTQLCNPLTLQYLCSLGFRSSVSSRCFITAIVRVCGQVRDWVMGKLELEMETDPSVTVSFTPSASSSAFQWFLPLFFFLTSVAVYVVVRWWWSPPHPPFWECCHGCKVWTGGCWAHGPGGLWCWASEVWGYIQVKSDNVAKTQVFQFILKGVFHFGCGYAGHSGYQKKKSRLLMKS